MKLDKFGKNLVSGFLKDIKDNGVVCKQDVLSIENQIEGVISSSININAFTTMKSSTNVRELTLALECLLSEQEEELPITVDVVVNNINRLKSRVNSIVNDLTRGNQEFDFELVTNIVENHYLSKFEGEGMVDLADSGVDSVVSDLTYIVEILTKDKSDVYSSRVLEEAHEVGKKLYQKPSNLFSLLRMSLKNTISLDMDSTDISEVTLRDIINVFVVNNKLANDLIKFRSELSELQTSLLFDYKYDNNLNNDTVFTYNMLNKKVENLSNLLEDEVSIYFIRLFMKIINK